MSQTPPQLEGQIEAPNPMELFWEKNKLLINAVLIAAVLAIAVNYGLRYMRQQEIDQRWGGLAIKSGMNLVYADGGSQKGLLGLGSGNPQMMSTLALFYYGETKLELLSELPSSIRDADQSELVAFLAGEAKGTAAEPLTLWVLAHRAIGNQDWDQATARLDMLEEGFPDHFLCSKSAHPIQWRDQVETEVDPENEEGPEAEDGATEPELLPARPGSAVSSVRARIISERQFRAEHPSFFEAPKPDFKQAVVIDLGERGKFKIAFYDDKATQHRDAFLRLAGDGFWTGQRIHQVTRQAEGQTTDRPEEISFGLVSSKEDTISSWQNDEDLADEGNALPWESNDLSHFPFMVAAEPHTDGKSQIQRIVINVNDAAVRDGSRVIFGQVVEGMDVISEILSAELSTESEEVAGRGRPVDFITIESVTVVERE